MRLYRDWLDRHFQLVFRIKPRDVIFYLESYSACLPLLSPVLHLLAFQEDGLAWGDSGCPYSTPRLVYHRELSWFRNHWNPLASVSGVPGLKVSTATAQLTCIYWWENQKASDITKKAQPANGDDVWFSKDFWPRTVKKLSVLRAKILDVWPWVVVLPLIPKSKQHPHLQSAL